MTDQHTYELIENFLHGNMTENERLAFKDKMAKDDALAAKVDEVRSIEEAIHYACLADLKATVGKDIKKINYDHGIRWGRATGLFIISAVLFSTLTLYFISDHRKTENQSVNSEKVREEDVSRKVARKENSTSTYNELERRKEDLHLPSVSNRHERARVATNEAAPAEAPIEAIKEAQEKHADQKITSTETDILPGGEARGDRTSGSPSLGETSIECSKTFEIKAEPACRNKESGSISILTDGSNGFHFYVNEFSSSTGIFHNLPAGEHQVKVTYNKECTFTKMVVIAEKWCPLNTAYSFNPDYNEKWEIKYESGAEGMFMIYTKSSKEIYKNTFGSGNESWSGTDTHGTLVPTGVYIAIIEYSDGRKEKVELTVVR